MIIVATPTVNGDIRLTTYGTLEMGVVPKLAFIEKATPKDMINRATQRNMYLLIYSVFIIFFFFPQNVY
jgi:hypothetical protein